MVAWQNESSSTTSIFMIFYAFQIIRSAVKPKMDRSGGHSRVVNTDFVFVLLLAIKCTFWNKMHVVTCMWLFVKKKHKSIFTVYVHGSELHLIFLMRYLICIENDSSCHICNANGNPVLHITGSMVSLRRTFGLPFTQTSNCHDSPEQVSETTENIKENRS